MLLSRVSFREILMFLRVIAGFGVVVALLASARPVGAPVPRTPIQHLVVIYGENISFDHYFGVYPTALNPEGEPAFHALPNTPEINGLRGALLTDNPNARNTENGTGATNPFRLDRTQASTSDQSHSYVAEQRAYHDGAMDLFPRYTGRAGTGGTGAFGTAGLVMGYFDGNTVTGMWNYAQHFAMSDNSYGDQYGPSTPGAIDLIAGQTNGLVLVTGRAGSYLVADGQGGSTMIGDPDPADDLCSGTSTVRMTGNNIGDLLNKAGVTWGWFEGGFDLTVTNADGTTGCGRKTHSDVLNRDITDYVPHHEPFQYYASTANPRHLRPSSVAAIGTSNDGGANHQYDIKDFYAAARAGHLPAVSYLKASAFEDAHAGNSDPIDEQRFVAEVINFLQQTPEWAHTAVILAYDDSDGWYDHQMAPIGNASFDSLRDQISAPGRCGVRGVTAQLGGVGGASSVNGRCGPGTRQPFLVVSPWARVNHVDHTQIIQSSISHFIEDNWLGGKRMGDGSFDAGAGSILGLFDFDGKGHAPRLFLDPASGVAISMPAAAKH
ncbi:MAG TPA: alkaline phosphatase family protein [Gemmatimonadales bacterium]|jgi:phospholipase C